MWRFFRELGVEVIYFNAQRYAQADNFHQDVFNRLINNGGRPRILVVDELDKLAERTGEQEGRTSEIVGSVNELLSEGRMSGVPNNELFGRDGCNVDEPV